MSPAQYEQRRVDKFRCALNSLQGSPSTVILGASHLHRLQFGEQTQVAAAGGGCVPALLKALREAQIAASVRESARVVCVSLGTNDKHHTWAEFYHSLSAVVDSLRVLFPRAGLTYVTPFQSRAVPSRDQHALLHEARKIAGLKVHMNTIRPDPSDFYDGTHLRFQSGQRLLVPFLMGICNRVATENRPLFVSQLVRADMSYASSLVRGNQQVGRNNYPTLASSTQAAPTQPTTQRLLGVPVHQAATSVSGYATKDSLLRLFSHFLDSHPERLGTA